MVRPHQLEAQLEASGDYDPICGEVVEHAEWLDLARDYSSIHREHLRECLHDPSRLQAASDLAEWTRDWSCPGGTRMDECV